MCASPPTGARPDGRARIAYRIKQLELAIRADIDVMARAHGITAVQYTALTVLRRQPGMSGAQLARRSFVSAQAGSEMIAHLERKALVRRDPHPSNRRILCIRLTEEGQAVVNACEVEMEKIEGRMLDGVATDGASELYEILDVCIRNLAGR